MVSLSKSRILLSKEENKMEVKIVGSIQFKNHALPVYGDLDEPLFKATDVADLLEYGSNNVWNLTSICEEDEKVVL